jgi:hypothetical protein
MSALFALIAALLLLWCGLAHLFWPVGCARRKAPASRARSERPVIGTGRRATAAELPVVALRYAPVRVSRGAAGERASEALRLVLEDSSQTAAESLRSAVRFALPVGGTVPEEQAAVAKPLYVKVRRVRQLGGGRLQLELREPAVFEVPWRRDLVAEFD